jgi:alpha-1,6-mannosyltransferase
MLNYFNKVAAQKKLIFFITPIFFITLIAGQVFIKRESFPLLLCWQILLYSFFCIAYILKEHISIRHIFIAAILLRLASAFLTPTLSDDVYRFIWDGQLIVQHQNPLLTTPNMWLQQAGKNVANYSYFEKLHSLINHPQFYTCYPPLMQGVFYIGAAIGGTDINVSIAIIKLMIAFIDCIGIFFLYKLLLHFSLNLKLIILYAINPLVIVEGSGNAHFEVVQVALMVIACYYLVTKKWLWAVLFWALAIVTKLIPLLLLPLFLKHLGFKKGVLFSVATLLLASITFLPFLSGTSIKGFASSLNLYFQNFEFNASIYYIAREIGWAVKGYNYISFIGPFLMGIFLLLYFIIFIINRKIDFIKFCNLVVIVFSLYYVFATTVHPWYMINLLSFAIIANKRYALVWMATAFLSYMAYSNNAFKENFYLIGLEYGIVLIAFLYPIIQKRKLKFS